MAQARSNFGEYRDAGGLAKAAMAALGAIAFVGLLVIGSAWMQIGLLERIGAGVEVISEDTRLANDIRHGLVNLAWVMTYVVTSILFLVWVNRSAKNAWVLGRNVMTITPGWCVGWYFIPFLNLVRPFQAMREIWHASAPGSAPGRLQGTTPPLVGVWWTAWIIDNMFGWFSGRTFDGESVPELLTASRVEMVGQAIGCVAAGLALTLVHQVTKRQNEAHRGGGIEAEVFA